MTTRTEPLSTAAEAFSRPSYRPDIDGLRCVAVAAVIVNHAVKAWMPSGFLGVDIFFVISGFVITASLVSHQRSGLSGYLSAFYGRRFRRLLPALLLFVAIAAISICLVNPKPAPSLQAGMASVFGVSNLFFLREKTNYFGADADLNIFTHTWSLGVEEQFYLVFPLFVWVAGLAGSPGRRQALRLLLLLLPTMSFSWLLFRSLSAADPSAAFFLMPARFWELGSGCLCFLWASFFLSPRLRVLRYPLPILIILLLALFVGPQASLLSSYRLTTLVVGLTALLLLSLHPGTLAYRFLSGKAMVLLGKMSYSLYLWHWGFLCIARWTVGVNAYSMPVILVLTGLAAWLSYAKVELRFRYADLSRSPFSVLVAGLGSSTLLLGLLALLNGVQARLFMSVNSPLDRFEEIDNVPIYDNCNFFRSHIAFRPTASLKACTFLPSSDGGGRQPHRLRHLYYLGNSHASQLTGMISAIREKGGYGQTLLITGAIKSPPLPSSLMNPPWSGDSWTEQGISTQNQIASEILSLAHPGDVIVLGNDLISFGTAADYRAKPEAGSAEALTTWLGRLSQFARRADQRGLTVVVLQAVPFFNPLSADLNPDLCRTTWFRPQTPAACLQSAPRASIRAAMAHVNAALARLASEHDNLFLFDPFDPVCPGAICFNHNREGRLYSDNKHLNNRGSRLLTDSFLAFLRAKGL